MLLTNLKAQFTFNNYYQSGNLSGVCHVQILPDNTYICSGYFKDSLTSQQGVEFRRLDQTGSTIIRKRYKVGAEDIATYLNNRYFTEHGNSRFFASGATYTGTLMTVLFMAISPTTLDTLFCKRYIDGNEYYLAHTFKIKPNEIWLVGNKFNSTTNLPMRPVIFKYDTLGNLLAVKEFTNYLNRDCLSILYNHTNSTFIMAGSNFNNSPSNFEIACIDTTGIVQWTNNVGGDQLWVKGMMLSGNDLFTCGSIVPAFPGNTNILELRKFNTNNGTQIFKKNYGKISFGNTFYAMNPTTDGNIILTGNYTSTYYSSVTGRHDALIMKVKLNGDSLWARTFNMFPNTSSNAETFFDIKQTPDNGFIACGAPIYVPTPQSQSWVVKTDSLGMAPGAITVNLNEQELPQFSTTIYPNPFKTSIQVEANNALNITLRISDVFGKLQHTQNLKETNTKIDLELLPPGIYFVSFSNEQGQSKTIKLVKE